MATITKAIIPVAGWGTRRLPITKAIDKCMLPVGNRPIVDYVVRDCIKAGIKEIFFVVNKGSTQLQQYYSENQRLNQFLEYNRKQDLMELAHPPRDVIFHFVEQDSNDKYGTAIPVALVYPQLKKGESVFMAMGDAFFHTTDGGSEFEKLIQATPENGVSLLSTEVPMEQVGHFGVIDFDEMTGAFRQVIDRPTVEQAPSNQANAATYVLNYDLLTKIYEYGQLEVSGEFVITGPINQYVLDGGVVGVQKATGEYLDCGNVHGWLHANQLIVNHQV